jgi:hypothetical protein
MKAKLIKEDDGYVLYTQGFFKASTNHSLIEQLNIEDGNIRYKLSKQNCDEIFGIVDVIDVTYKQVRKEFDGIIDSFTEAFAKQCINKAMELNKDKVFTLEQVLNAFYAGWISKDKTYPEAQKSYKGYLERHVIQPTEIEVEIEMEKVVDETKIVGSVKEVKGSGDKITTYKTIPKLDSEGCLILKKI